MITCVFAVLLLTAGMMPSSLSAHEAVMPASEKLHDQNAVSRHVVASAADTPAQQAQSSTAAAPSAQQIDQWIKQLSSQSCCSDWTNADWTSVSLDPYAHAQLIELASADETIGYFVLSAAESGEWVLTEYGTGRYPLFGIEILYRMLAQQEEMTASPSSDAKNAPDPAETKEQMSAWIHERYEAERLYFNALEAVWALKKRGSGEIIYADAKTAEMYPLDASVRNLPVSAAADGWPINALENVHESAYEAVDPYMHMHWLTSEPEQAANAKELHNMLQRDSSAVYVALIYNGLVTDPCAVTALVQTESDASRQQAQAAAQSLSRDRTAFVGIDKYGTKYVPFSLLAEKGHVYAP